MEPIANRFHPGPGKAFVTFSYPMLSPAGLLPTVWSSVLTPADSRDMRLVMGFL